MKKHLNKLVEAGFNAVIENGVLTVKAIRKGIDEQLFFTRSGICTDLIKDGEEFSSRNFSDLDEYIATA
jgi:hypothetical protein